MDGNDNGHANTTRPLGSLAASASARARLRKPAGLDRVRERFAAARSARLRYLGAGPVLAERPTAGPVPARRAVPRAARARGRRLVEPAARCVHAGRRSAHRRARGPRARREEWYAFGRAARGVAGRGHRRRPAASRRRAPAVRSEPLRVPLLREERARRAHDARAGARAAARRSSSRARSSRRTLGCKAGRSRAGPRSGRTA